MLFLPIPLSNLALHQTLVYSHITFSKANQTLNNFLDLVCSTSIMTAVLIRVNICCQSKYWQIDAKHALLTLFPHFAD